MCFYRVYIAMDDAMVRQKIHQLTRTGSHRRQGSFRNSAKRKDKGKAKTNGDNEHPGPTFLRNVMSRRFKHRTLIVGIVLFTGMIGIVIVSVIYANI